MFQNSDYGKSAEFNPYFLQNSVRETATPAAYGKRRSRSDGGKDVRLPLRQAQGAKTETSLRRSFFQRLRQSHLRKTGAGINVES